MRRITFFTAACLFISIINASAQGLVINEIVSSNASINTDEDGTYQDWVELYNGGTTAVNLDGYGLSDDVTLPYKWYFPNMSMPAGSYLLVWCSDKDRSEAGMPLHTNFKISGSGETIVLTDADGTTVNSVPATVIPSNVSYGRLPNGTGSFYFFQSPTPDAANSGTGFTEILPPPTFSLPGGFFATPQTLTLSTTVPGATILYTVDGSEPNISNIGGTTYSYKNQYPEHPGDPFGTFLTKSYATLQYGTPISIVDRSPQPNKIASISTTFSLTPDYIPAAPISKGTVVRAKLVKSGSLESPVISRTYIISPLGSSRYSLPVVSLSINENELFDYNNGIYVAGVDGDQWRADNPTTSTDFLEGIGNYYREGIEDEKVANMSYFVNGQEVLNQDIGIRIHGGISRSFQSKSLALYSRADYGSANMNYPFFHDLPYSNFDKLVLRNSGGDFQTTMFRDALNQEVCRFLYPDKEACQNTITFVNGEYWGILNLRDRYGDSYFKRVYNADAVDYLESDGAPKEGDADNYNAMLDYVNTHPLAVSTNYDYIKTQLDPENFADYFIANIFLLNEDWPNNNVEFWRNKIPVNDLSAASGLDGRWRWLFHDMDNTLGVVSGDFNLNTLAIATSVDTTPFNPGWSTLLLRKLLENTEFKNYFINRFADLLNTSFLPNRVTSIINSMEAALYSEIPEHIARWKSPPAMSDYDYYVQSERDFASQRPDLQRNHIRTVFSVAANINAMLDVDDVAHGYIKMNTIDVKNGTPGITGNPYPWTGIYFSNIPVMVKAVALPGYTFTNWSGASSATAAEITITQAASFNLTAHFTQTAVATPQPIYFWALDGTIANNQPLTGINSTFKVGTTDGVINYTSCLTGYPFTSTDPLWRHASMERRNNPTTINYSPEANNNVAYAAANIKGIQVKEPFQTGSLENTMVFNFGTNGYKDIKFSFAAVNELSNVNAILIDYSVNTGTPNWINTGLASSNLSLTAVYQLFNIDFTSITAANNNPDFKIRLRFAGADLTVDAGNRVTFNNFAVIGTSMMLATNTFEDSKFIVYPNPFNDLLSVNGITGGDYQIYSVEGKLVMEGTIAPQLDLSRLLKGMYLLRLTSDGRTETKKIVKR